MQRIYRKAPVLIEMSDAEFVPAVLNFPPRAAARWEASIEYGLPPLRCDLQVNGISLGQTKDEVLELFGNPTSTSFEQSNNCEFWEYKGPNYGFNTRLFCLSQTEEDREDAIAPLTICFNNDSVSMVSGGDLLIRGKSIAKAGDQLDHEVLMLGIPASNDKPLPPYYQSMFWEEDDWSVNITSERAVIRVSLSEPWWPPEDEE